MKKLLRFIIVFTHNEISFILNCLSLYYLYQIPFLILNFSMSFLFEIKLQQNYKVCDWRSHKRVQQFHVDVEKSTSKVEGLIVCNRFYVDDFNLHGNQGEKWERSTWEIKWWFHTKVKWDDGVSWMLN